MECGSLAPALPLPSSLGANSETYLHATHPIRHGQAFESFERVCGNETAESSDLVPRMKRRPRWRRLQSVFFSIACVAQTKACALAPSRHAGYNFSVSTVSQSIGLKVLFFGRLKEIVGHAEESLTSADAATIEQLFALYAARHPELAKFRPSLVASCNQEFAAWNTALHPGDEVAFLPPVSGG
jgi:molybdopterin synthase sulfur carrier subunit